MCDRLEDLDFADDICLLAQRFRDMEDKLMRLQQEAIKTGLKINANKTKKKVKQSRYTPWRRLGGEEI